MTLSHGLALYIKTWCEAHTGTRTLQLLNSHTFSHSETHLIIVREEQYSNTKAKVQKITSLNATNKPSVKDFFQNHQIISLKTIMGLLSESINCTVNST